ncbi:hypothetical protein ACN47E_005966 [Coniothyrium glycines]
MNRQLAITEEDQLLSCAGDKPLQLNGHVYLPQPDRCHKLLVYYFDVCIATYRLLHQPTIESWLTIVSDNDHHARPLSYGIGRAKTATVLAVLAIASFHEEKAQGPIAMPLENGNPIASESDQLFSEASRLTNAETGFPRLESAQCRLLQVLYLLMSCRFNQAWYTFGHALQIISALGLYRRDNYKQAGSSYRRDYIEEQGRKRTFWVAYILDKYLGTILGRPQHYHDEDVDQDLPCAINDEDMTSAGPRLTGSGDCLLESLVVHAKLAQIAEKISREVYSLKVVPDEARLAASHRLGAELRQWRAALPPFLGAVDPSSLIPKFRRQATMLKMSYCHAVMLAHRPFLLKVKTRNSDVTQTLAKESVAECIAAARSVLNAVDRMESEGRLFHAFWWTHYICFCALVVLYVWAIQESSNTTTSEERQSMLDQADRCLQHLAAATASNSPSRRYSIILQELRNEAIRKTSRTVLEATATVGRPIEEHLVDGATSTFGPDATTEQWHSMFDSSTDTATPGLQNLLDDWRTTDWLHIDSSAFGPFPEALNDTVDWMDDGV